MFDMLGSISLDFHIDIILLKTISPLKLYKRHSVKIRVKISLIA